MKLMVLDGNSVLNRAFYGVRLLSTADGLYTNAVFGFLNILLKLLLEEKPDGVCVTFDVKAPTFRHERYNEYKAQRKPMPEELAVQLPLIRDVLDAMNIPRYELAGWEADDLIGTISKKCEEAGWQCAVVTGDKDSFQLISENTHVLHVKSRMGQTETREIDPAAFFEEYGFSPRGIVDLKALMGDTSDNIPGVKGVGEKTAMELMRSFGTLDAVYENIDAPSIKESVRKKLNEGKESAYLSYELAEIHRDAPIDFSPDNCLRREVDNDSLYTVLKKLEMNRIIERLGLKAPAQEESAAEIFEGECVSMGITDENSLRDAIAAMTGKSCGVWVTSELDTVVFTSDCSAWIFEESEYTGDFDTCLRCVFEADIKKTGHDIKDIQRRLLKRGYSAAGWEFDTAVAAYLLDPTASSYEIEKLTERYCGFCLPDSSDTGDGQLTLLSDRQKVLADVLSRAAAVEAVREALLPRLEEQGLCRVFYEIELPLCPVLADMENEGIYLDREALTNYGEWLRRGMEDIESQIFALAGGKFNINSPKQLGEVLFEKLMLPAPKKTKTGWSTNIDVLEKLVGKHDIIPLIMEYRQLSKLKSTYADGLVRYIGPDGRIRTTFQMTVTATGRLSSTDPNLQNIPVRRELGGEIRKMFTAAPGNVLVDADYSQIELRLLAHISGDETMRDTFLSGGDIHRVTASQVLGIAPEEVTDKQRSSAKAVNFGIVYGISAFSLSQDIGVSVAEAKRYMDGYFEKYRGVREYMEKVVSDAGRDGFASTVYGRRRPLPELKASNFNLRSFGERVARNMPIQGTAADIMKIAMIKVHRRLAREGLKARLILQVHDELIVECPAEEADTVKKLLCEEMESAAALSVPLTADAGAGRSWYDAK